MKLKTVLSLTPLFLLVPPTANAQSDVSGTIPGTTDTYTCEFVAEGVVLARLSGLGTLTVTAGTGSSAETESGTGTVQATAPATGESTSGCTFDVPSYGSYSVTITSN